MEVSRNEAVQLIRLRVIALLIAIASIAYIFLVNWSVNLECRSSAKGVTELLAPMLAVECASSQSE